VRKVIVIGLDGLDPRIVSRLIAAGQLPNLARLKEQGGLGSVATVRPAQTPVAWSTFATGTNPGGHGIFDFLRRNPETYFPEPAFSRYEQKNAFLPPRAVNLRRGAPIWELLGTAGHNVTVLRCPCTYPPDPARGRMLSGLGVPDVRGGFGTTTFYTTSDVAEPRESENLVRLQALGEGVFSAYLIGPRNPRTRANVHSDVTLEVDSENRRATLRSDGTPRQLEIQQGCWSDWLRINFKLGLLQSVRGMVRFYLIQCTPQPLLHASPVNFDPDAPFFPISHPPDYARELAQRIGLYYTTGMVEDHTGLNNERVSEAAFLDQCEIVWRERESMMLEELRSFKEGLFYCLFDTPDRVQHMFWRYREPDHPANRAAPRDPAFMPVVDDCYRRCDDAVGTALEFSDEETLFIALSDHGFNSFRRGVDLNKWLYDCGFLALRQGVGPGAEAGDLLRQVDWERTRAYALGLTGIYLNLKGRESQGIVPPEEASAVKTALIQGLTGLPDVEQGGAPAICRVQPREDVYSGPYLAEAPDLLIDFAAGYRVSWSSSMGGVAGSQFEDNGKKWSGDHIIDPEQVPGVLTMNRPFRQQGARLVDLAPTILAALGVPKGQAMEGKSLFA
jgi:predicted AlkP superfamily phosphohydrolase/phosphomutase